MATEREDGNPYSNFNFVVEVDGHFADVRVARLNTDKDERVFRETCRDDDMWRERCLGNCLCFCYSCRRLWLLRGFLGSAGTDCCTASGIRTYG